MLDIIKMMEIRIRHNPELAMASKNWYVRSLANILLIYWSEEQLNRTYSSYDFACARASMLFYNAIAEGRDLI